MLTADSRPVGPRSLFVALPGTVLDGRRFIPDAIEKGACGIVLEPGADPNPRPERSVPFYYVKDAHAALAILARAFYDSPSSRLTVVGVTGTNGKTTTATLLYDLFTQLGYKCGLLSTVCVKVADQVSEAHHTTPDSLELNSLMHQMVQAGCTHVFMEVSSHALVQKRVYGIDFDVAVFSNITRDHLDYHGTFANYLAAKKSFFDALKPSAIALINRDDRNAGVMVQNTAAHTVGYALHAPADFQAVVREQHLDGTLLELNGTEMHSRLCGDFNAYNLLAVYSVARVLLPKLPEADLLSRLSLLKPVQGRFEVLKSPREFYAVVDYAHTPDAVENVLQTIQSLSPREVVTVIGAGGNRDTGKRPQMAAVAARLSNRIILTSDNPRYEDPLEIIAQMKAGLSPDQEARTLTIPDRAQAIKTACALAQKGDAVLVAGKGHETYQEIAGIRHHFNDKEILEQLFGQES